MSLPGNTEMVINYEDQKTKANIIESSAEKIIETPISLITDKDSLPPSENKSDFVSLAPYWYRTDNGELEVKDGEVNPETENYPDSDHLETVATNIYITSLAAKLADHKDKSAKFTKYAISALESWFINEETKMNPNFEYAQMRPGERTGKFWGIIEGENLIRIVEGIKFLKEKDFIETETLAEVKNWFRQYLNWLQTSEKAIGNDEGKNERERKGAKGMPNNHGTFYDVQVAYIADLLGKEDLASKTIEEAKERIADQIEPNGEMPEETARKTPYSYQIFNLFGLARLAILGEKYNIDLWNFESENGSSLKKAFEYFSDQLSKSEEDNPFEVNRTGELYYTYRAASAAYEKESYWDIPSKFYDDHLTDEITSLIFE